MTSPSRSTIRRSTPWVLGCCGPKFTVRMSPPTSRSRVIVTPGARVCSDLVSGMRSGLRRCRLPDLVVFGEVDRFAADRIVAAQWVAHPVVRHQDPGQVRMAREVDAEHVPRLTLIPVGGRVDVVRAVHPGIVFGHEDADAQLPVRLHVPELVHKLEALRRLLDGWGGQVIDTRHKDVALVALRLEFGQRLAKALAGHTDPFGARDDAVGENALSQLERRHKRGLIPWALIFSCRIISAFSTSSGRGGQPGMYTSTGTILSTP